MIKTSFLFVSNLTSVNNVALFKNSELKPRITLRDDKGEIIKKADGNEARYYLVPDTVLSVKDGQKISAGDVLARLPKETSKTKDITGGLPRITELLEARNPSNPAVVTEIDGVVTFGKIMQFFDCFLPSKLDLRCDCKLLKSDARTLSFCKNCL